jgi:type IV secretory pathway VirB10-like protein
MEERQDDKNKTERFAAGASPAESAEDEPEEVAEDPRPKGVRATFREAFERARHGRKGGGKAQPPTNPSVNDRTARNRDRTRTLFACVAGLVAVLVIFLGVFSSSHTPTQRQAAIKRNPSLGRPEAHGLPAGSVTPLLSAEAGSQEGAGGQVTPEDINNTSAPRASREAPPDALTVPGAGARAAPRRTAPQNPQKLNDVPFTDPALEAYRQRLKPSTSDAQPEAPRQPAPPVTSESEGLAKASLVYVRGIAGSGAPAGMPATLSPAAGSAEAAFLNANLWDGLPAGTRLVARLQTPVSTAVKAPVVAVIETHYERDGEIVLPAGSKAFGELESGTRSGYVGIRFHSLQFPDGPTEKIEGSAMSLDFGPLKGQVTGRNRGKQFLARAVTGVGSVAAFAVGHPGGLAGPMDNSVLLRDRISQNIGMAGEQEVMNLAYAQEIVVTIPGNTRFFIVLQQGAGREGAKPSLRPAGSPSGGANLAGFPSASEMRELIALKKQLDSMRQDTAATPVSAGAKGVEP